MARTVADCAALLGALAGVDPRDAATRAGAGKAAPDYTGFLDAAGLTGARIGVARNLAGFNVKVDAVFDDAVAALKSAGAVVIDADLPGAADFGDAELEVLLYEFKDGLNAYLATLGAAAPVRNLAELIAWNERERAREMPWFGQELFERAQEKGPLTETKYISARTKCIRLARTLGLDAALARHKLDAIVFPSNQPAWPTDYLNGDHFVGGNTSFAAIAGYPSITVPMGFVHELPVGLSFAGPAWSEGPLLKYAYAFEQQTKARRSPRFLTTLV
jgi:amidase